MIRASWLAFATADAGGSFYFQCAVTIFCPVCKVISLKIACEQEYAWNVDSNGTWCAVIASAAEIGTKLFADFVHCF